MTGALLLTAVGGVLAFVIAPRNQRITRIIAVFCGLGALSYSLRIWQDPAASIRPLLSAHSWFSHYPGIELFSGSFDLLFRSSPFGNLVAASSCFIGVLVSVYTLGRGSAKSRDHSAAYMIWAMFGTLVVAWSDNLILLLLGWEIVSLMLYMLSQWEVPNGNAAEKSLVTLGITDLGMLASIAFLAGDGRIHGFTLSEMRIEVASPGTIVGYLLFLFAAFAKSGIIPFHSWIPSVAKSARSEVSALLPASLDKLLGIYLLTRMSLVVFEVGSWASLLMILLGAFTILGAVLMALVQHDLKRLLGFHAVSQVGYMVLGLGIGTTLGVVGALFHMINNIIYKTGLFFISGTIEKAAGTTDMSDLRGLGKHLPWTFLCTIIFAFSISGVPPLNGFVSKWILYQSTISMGGILGSVAFIAAVFGSVLTLASFVKVIHSVFIGPARSEEKPRGRETIYTILPMIVLAACCIALGIFALDGVDILFHGVTSELGLPPLQFDSWHKIELPGGSWSSLLTLAAIIIAMLFGFVFYLAGGLGNRRVVDTFIGGEQTRNRLSFYSGTHFYSDLQRLPVIQTIIKDCEAGVLDPFRWGRLAGSAVVAQLRAFHSGLLTLYVAYALIGLSILIIIMVV